MFLLKNVDISLGKGALFSVVAILIVFFVLAVLIICVTLIGYIQKNNATKKDSQEVKVANEVPTKKFTIEDIKDEDMMVAALVATSDFVEETKVKDARIVSIKQIG